MATRISSRLEDLRVQVAQGMFTNPVAEEAIEETAEDQEEVSEEAEEIEEETEELDEAQKIVRKDGKLTHVDDDRDAPVKDSHLAKNVHQLNLAKHLRKHAGLSSDSHVYFDGTDLVHGEKTVVRNAIHPNSKHTVGDLGDALKNHVTK
jgi:hypothetical protein